MGSKKTLVIGASANPTRYSYIAIQSLREYGHPVVALAKRPGHVADVDILTEFPENEDIHTVTMYIGPKNQPEYQQLLLDLNPERVIFNPGTENIDLIVALETSGIEAIEGCTLVMLNTGYY
ncbi:MAG TPA: CoA-binding protein [Draconibacterium sp.]|nr:CoA-binding protein [Draconibacterium sp.]